MKLSKLNQHFDGRHLLKRSQFEIFIQNRRVFKTTVRFTPEQAAIHVLPLSEAMIADGKASLLQAFQLTPAQVDEIYTPGGLYFGYIFTDTGTWEEARQWATERALDEKVIQLMGGVTQVLDERYDLIARLGLDGATLLAPGLAAEQQADQAAEELVAAHKEQLRACWHASGRKTIGFEPYDTAYENNCFEQWYATQHLSSELPLPVPLP